MLFDRVWVVSIDPEDGIVETVTNPVGPHVMRYLHHATHAKRLQGRVIEDGGAADVRDPNAGMVNYLGAP
jgi:hypothetical protein